MATRTLQMWIDPELGWQIVVPPTIHPGDTVEFEYATLGSATPASITVSNFNSGMWTNTSSITISRGSSTNKGVRSDNTISTQQLQFSATGQTTQFRTITISPTPDTDPDPFGWSASTGNIPNSEVISASTTITGINVPVPISVTNGLYSINTIEWFSSSAGQGPQITNNQTVYLSTVSPSGFSQSKTVTATIGDRSGTWSVSTAAGPPASGLICTKDTLPIYLKPDVIDFFAGDDLVGPVTAPDNMRSFFRGSVWIPDIPQNAALPTSGDIELTDFLGVCTYLALTQAGRNIFAGGDTTIGQTSVTVTRSLTHVPTGTTLLDHPRVGHGNIISVCEISWQLIEETAGFDTGVIIGPASSAFADNNYVLNLTATAPVNQERTYKGAVRMRIRLKANPAIMIDHYIQYGFSFKGP